MNSKIPRFKIGFASSGESRTNVPSGILDTNGAWVRYEDHVAAFEAHVPQAWTNLLAYVLQDDLHNRTTPRIIDIAYTAFMAAKAVNKENGGPSDWFNDTKPVVMEAIAALRNDLIEELPSVLPVTAAPAVAAPMVPGMPPTDNQRPYDDSEPDGYMESDNEWIDRNLLAVRWLIENHAAIRSALAAAPQPPVCKGSPGECAHNGACMYRCGAPLVAPSAVSTQEVSAACEQLKTEIAVLSEKFPETRSATLTQQMLQPLHNLLYTAQLQTSKPDMHRAIGKARLALAKLRETLPSQPAPVVEGDVFRELIEFLLHADEPIAYLRCWNEGNFDACKMEWPEAPHTLYPEPDVVPTPKPQREYYYRQTGCRASNSGAPDCICWHLEGTGPFADRPESVRSWRTKGEPK